MTRPWFHVLILAGAMLGLAAAADAESCGPPPPAKPQRWTGGESFPPLPLPATPLRRSEKKRPPAPPALIGKLQYGKIVEGTDGEGRKYSYRDWTTDPGDLNGLMDHVKTDLKLSYRGMQVTVNDFQFDPQQIPILYLTGHEPISFTPEIRKKLRWFINDGGTVIADACCGSKAFRESFVKEFDEIFPHHKMQVLPEDHPVYKSFYDIKEVGYQVEGKAPYKARPYLEGIDIGARTAVIMTPYDLSCGWDGHQHAKGERIWPAADALHLGVNIIAYTLAEYPVGRYLAEQKVYYDAGKNAGDRFVFGQIVHGGNWEPTPKAVPELLKYVKANTTMEAQFQRDQVDLGKTNLDGRTFLFMSGMHDFTFTEAEVGNLRGFLRNGGILLAESACGRHEFDAAFRREMAKVLPNTPLSPVPAGHAMFSAIAKLAVTKVETTPMLKKAAPDLDKPAFEGAQINGTLAVIYSKYSLSTGWQTEEDPYAVGYARSDALKMGANVVMYAMTH
jgi:hypothetical protein